MTLLPLVPTRVSAIAGPPPRSDDCPFCGVELRGWVQQVWYDGEIVPACMLCALCHGLDRPRAGEEITPIWLPEMTQRALIAVTRRLHLLRVAHGQAPVTSTVPPQGVLILSQAWGLHLALARRGSLATARLGTVDLAELAEALDDARRAGAEIPALLGGLRLLPLGRFFDEQGVDIYPHALAAYLTPAKGIAA